MQRVLISTPSISRHDAVSNDVWLQQAYFLSLGWDCKVYAELVPKDLLDNVCDFFTAEAMSFDPRVIWIYHHSVFWKQGDTLLEKARCRKFLRYHNITPTHFFEKHGEKDGTYATKQGIAQTKRFVDSQQFEKFLSASEFSSGELKALGALPESCFSIAPFHHLNDFDSAKIDDTFALDSTKINILFVGRVVPNKGHLHLFSVLDAFIDGFGTNVCLHILGNSNWAPRPYVKELRAFAASRKLGDFIKFWGSSSFDALHTIYSKCQVFLVMSEHEGFCVPVIEAQHHRLPIVALDRTAVRETLGPDQICYEKLDYQQFAAAVHVVATDNDARKFLIDQGVKNLERFALPVLQKMLRSTL